MSWYKETGGFLFKTYSEDEKTVILTFLKHQTITQQSEIEEQVIMDL
jgi:hypothetical protein